ncbi:ARV1 [Blepharisma stoltei]|uniref:Protein ARV n=1 Tax=Blepharisma stoltei TaxID=1481888 RepID=A0AAU9IDZ0_9CILI|nr:unnamed protein product [Blepharisma stoltei]
MKCVECGKEVPKLYEELVKGNIALFQCEACGKVADKYVEYEFTLVFLNLILCKSQVYRHIIFNIDWSTSTYDILKILFFSSILDSSLASCESLPCWLLQIIKNCAVIILFFTGVYIAAYSSGIKCSKMFLLRAILFSSFGKLGNFMIITWKYSSLPSTFMALFIYLNNMIAIRECLEVHTIKAEIFISFAWMFKTLLSSWFI